MATSYYDPSVFTRVGNRGRMVTGVRRDGRGTTVNRSIQNPYGIAESTAFHPDPNYAGVVSGNSAPMSPLAGTAPAPEPNDFKTPLATANDIPIPVIPPTSEPVKSPNADLKWYAPGSDYRKREREKGSEWRATVIGLENPHGDPFAGFQTVTRPGESGAYTTGRSVSEQTARYNERKALREAWRREASRGGKRGPAPDLPIGGDANTLSSNNRQTDNAGLTEKSEWVRMFGRR